MEDMIKFEMPKNQSSIIKVLGVGGGGSNAVNHMHNQGITGVDFIVCNTDAQALDMSPVPNKISLGNKGLGAGSVPLVAEKAAIEKSDEIKKLLATNTEMLFITAGMGGGTGTGAAPVIAKLAKEIDLQDEQVSKILVVAIVTLPFSFEGRKRKQQAQKGIEELRKYADAVLIISNDKLRELYGNLGLSEAFKIADNVLLTAARGIAEIITVKAYVNIDFKDVNTVMKNSGVAIMGTGISEGDERARKAIEMAVKSPLLDDNDIKGTNSILLYLSSGSNEISMDEITEITEYIIDEAGQQVEIIWGAGQDESLGEKICVTVVATGFDKQPMQEKEQVKYDLYKSNTLKEEKPPAEVHTEEVKPPRPTRPAVEAYEDEDNETDEVDEIRLIRKEDPHAKSDHAEEDTQADEKPNIIRFSLDDPAPDKPEAEKPLKSQAEVDEMPEKLELEFTLREEAPPLQRPKAEPENPISKEEKDHLERKARERVERLRQMSIKLKSPGGLSELETEPAYRRKKVELSEEKPSEDSKVSRYTLGEDEDGPSLKDNSFLHDNVD